MFTKTLFPDTLQAIKLVASVPQVQKAYLAGGTALALQLGHRMSVDLYFFTSEEIDEQATAANLSKVSTFKESQLAWRTVLGLVGKTKFSIFFYKYKLIDKPLSFEDITVAGKKDIAAMKIQAISDRGVKRDFIDLYLLAKEFTLDEMFTFYDQKYGVLQENLYGLLKGLTYFIEADADEMPQMLMPIDWEEVKAFFLKETRRITSERINI